MNIDDPKLTAYALGELDEAGRATTAQAIADSPEAQLFVADTQHFASALRSQYGLELARESIVREKFISIHDDPFWSKAGPLAIAATLALLALIGAVALGTNKLSSAFTVSRSSSSQVAAGSRSVSDEFAPIEGEEGAQLGQNPSREADAGPYAYTGERPFVSAMSRPRSSFPIITASMSYLDVRRSIKAGVLPPKDAVRVEQMINYFPYDYPQPAEYEPFSVNVDIVTCPWETSHRLVRIGLKGREANIITEASRIEVEFNPTRIASYRLIGYDRQPTGRQNVNQTNVGSDTLAAGYTVTAFYEAVPVGQQSGTVDTRTQGQAAEQLLSAKLQLKTPGNDRTQFIERFIADEEVAFANAAPDLKFAAAVAEFGMILRDSEYKGNGTLEAVLEWAQQGKGADANGYRAEFIELVRKAQALKRG
jgi:uncharacterized protein DUF3520/protein with von Willebrand factor-like domain